MQAIDDPTRPKAGGALSLALARVRSWPRRLDRRRLLAFGVGVVGALVSQQAVARANQIEASLGVRTPVVVASLPLEPGTVIAADQLVSESWPSGLVPDGSLTDAPLAVGLIVTSPIGAGEPIVDRRTSRGAIGLRADELAVTLPVPLAPPPLEVGQVVSLVGIRGSDTGFGVVTSNLAEGRVLNVGGESVAIAVGAAEVGPILSYVAVGSVEIVITPRTD